MKNSFTCLPFSEVCLWYAFGDFLAICTDNQIMKSLCKIVIRDQEYLGTNVDEVNQLCALMREVLHRPNVVPNECRTTIFDCC